MTEITDYINNDIKAIAIDESIETVQDFFAELSFSHFPGLEDGTYLGSMALYDVETFDTDKKVSDYRYTLE